MSQTDEEKEAAYNRDILGIGIPEEPKELETVISGQPKSDPVKPF